MAHQGLPPNEIGANHPINTPIFASASGIEGASDINLDEVFSDCFFGFDLANNNNGNGQMTSPGGEEDGEYDDDNGQYAHAGDAMVAAAKEPMASSPPRNTRHNTRSKQRESVEPSMADLRITGPGPVYTNDAGQALRPIKPPAQPEPKQQQTKMGTVSQATRNAKGNKPKLAPSGFAGIAAIGGNGGPMAAVKTESQPTKKRRRRPDPRDLTEEQRVERRERNREHAKRSRIRKKFLLESLQDQLAGLREVNTNLRKLIRSELPEQATEILTQCMTQESLLLMDTDMKEATSLISKQAGLDEDGGRADPSTERQGLPEGIGGHSHVLTEPDYRLMLNLVQAQQNFTVSDPSLPDNPIVYASEGFLKLTGYTREQVIGRNCRFLQGPKTDQKMVDHIRDGVKDGKDTSVCLLNYKADGTPFWNQFFVAALRDANGNIVNFVGVQCEVNQVPLEIMRESAKQMAVWDINNA
mmetsp:Transcript_16306/g.38016  ORF Transcript_16306/g.38016 Transcript_16306/m.38016 type:complete len:470 (+) Transcript_16306:152-1561(+)